MASLQISEEDVLSQVIRWSQTAYETSAQLAHERAIVESLGLAWQCATARDVPPEGLAEADVLMVTSKVHVDAVVLANFAKSGARKLVLTTTSGVDHIDLYAASDLGVVVARCPLARRDAVVDHTIASLIWGMRQFGVLERAAAQGCWARGQLPQLAPRGIRGAKVGVVGLGVIGQQVKRVLTVLGAAVVGVDPNQGGDGPPVVLDDVLDDLDAITLHCQLHRANHHLLNASRLARLPQHAVVINTARGGLVDVDAALAQVGDGRLRAFVSDVFPEEPYPKMAQAQTQANVLWTPHSAGYVHDLSARLTQEISDTLTAWMSHEALPHRVC